MRIEFESANSHKLRVRYITTETKEVARIGYTNGFLFPHEKETRYIQLLG
jgi:hypothetical protein